MKREFDSKLWRVGNSHVVTIPSKIIKKYKLKEGQELIIIVKKE